MRSSDGLLGCGPTARSCRLSSGCDGHNESVPDARRVGFYGLDVYSLWDSMRVVTEYLTRLDPALAAAARRAYNCFEPYAEDVQEYARATALVPTSCEDEAVTVLRAMRAQRDELSRGWP